MRTDNAGRCGFIIGFIYFRTKYRECYVDAKLYRK